MGSKRRQRYPVQLQAGTADLLDQLIELGHRGGWLALGLERRGAVTKAALLDVALRRFAAGVEGVEA